ncbi:MAG: radical SAM protein [Lentisphaerae bacterium]|nr:radical SAM protein [Lentisphaerota bacterium]
MAVFNPSEAFFLQWHITDRCNLRCTHCYRTESKQDLSLSELSGVFRNFLRLREVVPQAKARVQLAGGEPLLSNHLFPVLDMIAEAGLQSRILSNGTLIDRPMAMGIRAHGCRIVQISLEGSRPTHDTIRGDGAFDRAIDGARRLREQDIQVTFAMTLSRQTVDDIPAVLEIARTLANRVGFHRLVPCGTGRALADRMLRPAEIKRAFRRIWEFRKAHPSIEIPLRDPLWKPYLRCGHAADTVNGCSAGYAGLCVDADGSVYPCRRLPVCLGNAVQDSLIELWRSLLMDQLRNRDGLRGKCGTCPLRWDCGGCRAIPFALTQDPLGEDPQCFFRPSWLQKKMIEAMFALEATANRGEGGG